MFFLDTKFNICSYSCVFFFIVNKYRCKYLTFSMNQQFLPLYLLLNLTFPFQIILLLLLYKTHFLITRHSNTHTHIITLLITYSLPIMRFVSIFIMYTFTQKKRICKEICVIMFLSSHLILGIL